MGNQPSGKLRPEAMYNLLETTNFSEAELRKWYQEFQKDYPDGQLNIDQFKDVYIQHFPNGNATKFAEHVFRTFDKDKNHKLDFREFMCALSVTARGSPSQRLQWAFDMYDIDQNGFITKDECHEIIKAIYQLQDPEQTTSASERCDPEAGTERIFAALDKNNDGTLSQEEFVDGASVDSFLVQLLTLQHVPDPSVPRF